MRASRPRPFFTVPLIFLLGIFSARLPSTIAALVHGSADFLSPISEIHQMLMSSYVTAPGAADLQRGAIDGMLEALNDPYAQYIPPVERAEFDKELLGRFCGIGAQVQIDDGLPTVVTPLDDSPAFRAGIVSGDKIVEVDGETTAGLTIDKVVSMLTGEQDTQVRIKVRRGEQLMDYTLTRQEIVVRAVQGVSRQPDGTWNFMLDPDQRIGYIRLEQFIPTAPLEMARALDSIGAAKGTLNGLIFDLRNNPGGDLEACLEIADLFLQQGAIVSVRGRSGKDQVYEASERGTLPEFPLVVLVNGFSASASEIVAGALSDHRRATVIGTRTFGKGLVQTVRPVSTLPGAQVKYTIQRYELPSGRVIQRADDSTTWGVDPSPGFYVPMTDQEEVASYLKRRDLDVLRKSMAPTGDGDAAPAAVVARWTDPLWIENDLMDKQLGAAVRSMRTRIATGAWNPLSDQSQQAALINSEELRRLEQAHERMTRSIVQIEERMKVIDNSIGGVTTSSKPNDLWAGDPDLTSGAITVFDKDGKKVADLRITGPELERWLILADVQPAPEATPAEQPAKNEMPASSDAAPPASNPHPATNDP